jgi:head-tail adaptor
MDGLLFHRADIERATVAYDTQGAPVETWGSVGTSIPCLIQRMSGVMEYQSRDMVFIPTHNGYFRFGTDIKVGDRITDQGGDVYLCRRIDSMPPASNQVETILELMEGFRP